VDNPENLWTTASEASPVRARRGKHRATGDHGLIGALHDHL